MSSVHHIEETLTSPSLRWHNFLSNCKGVASIEFAIILPVMVTILIGTFELSRAITVDRRFNHAANATADLITRQEDVDDSELDSIMQVIDEIMNPYSASSFKLTAINVIASMSDASRTAVCWSHDYREGGVNSYSEGQIYELPPGLVANGESIIVVEARYLYSPGLTSLFIRRVFPFRETVYVKPRTSAQVRKDSNICAAPT